MASLAVKQGLLGAQASVVAALGRQGFLEHELSNWGTWTCWIHMSHVP